MVASLTNGSWGQATEVSLPANALPAFTSYFAELIRSVLH